MNGKDTLFFARSRCKQVLLYNLAKFDFLGFDRILTGPVPIDRGSQTMLIENNFSEVLRRSSDLNPNHRFGLLGYWPRSNFDFSNIFCFHSSEHIRKCKN